MTMTEEEIRKTIPNDLLNSFSDAMEIIGWSVGQYGAIRYEFKREGYFDDNEFELVVIDWHDNAYDLLIRLKEDGPKLHKYEDVYEELTESNLWSALFFKAAGN